MTSRDLIGLSSALRRFERKRKKRFVARRGHLKCSGRAADSGSGVLERVSACESV